MTHSFSSLKNALAVAAWQWRWALQGGGSQSRAHDLQDMRDSDQLRRWRHIEWRVTRIRRASGAQANVVNLAALRIERARRRQTTC